MHTTLKNAELLKHSKLDKNAPTRFGLHRNHLQGAKVSAWLKITRLVNLLMVAIFKIVGDGSFPSVVSEPVFKINVQVEKEKNDWSMQGIFVG